LEHMSLPFADGARASVVQPIQAGADRLGAAIVLAERAALGDDELMALERAAGVAALRLAQARAVAEADRRFQAVCLDELVTGHLADRGVLHERAAAFGWDLAVPRAVLVAEIERLGERAFKQFAGTAHEGRARHQVAAAAAAILGSQAIVWERSTGLAALVVWSDARPDGLRLLGLELQAEMLRRLPSATVGIGIGHACADPLELASSYREAQRALTVGQRASGAGQVVLFERLGVERLLLACPEAELGAFHAATLGALVAYERTHPGSGLKATLAAFLAADRNVAQTARALYAHYNTTRYRLDRLEQLLGPFVGDPRRCLELELALQVERLLVRSAP
jgi:PucR family transcriptional regulator, purine catabolism regulatory protein